MAKKKTPKPLDDSNSIAGPNFRMSTESEKSGRGKVVQAIKNLSPKGASFPNHQLVFANERDLARFHQMRVEMTISKFMAAVAMAYAFDTEHPRLVVGGASDQYLTGNSTTVQKNGKTYLRGTQAAHFAIGTLWRGSQSIAREAEAKIKAALEKDGSSARASDLMPASSSLVRLMLAYDAATYSAPAFINQSDGKLEVIKQHFMLGLMPSSVATSPTDLNRELTVLGNRMTEFFLKRKINLDPIEKRLAAIANGSAKGFFQDPNDLAHNLPYQGEEPVYLGVNRDKLSDTNSDLVAGIVSVGSDVRRSSEQFTEIAVATREEIAKYG
ncbi:hypothetical protein Mal15_45980 [Stieleria maiorica]|uniref:Uncharacterized protein n=1 Tax=Stieleria maiorica TaxID=2795974 RepID=A0A5B9MNW7_9BACT|nr:hypothetical protein [Stieleria maiorica]QEG00528.1 hypothetical protein Mal15_45980 [Stieleria maiorica]